MYRDPKTFSIKNLVYDTEEASRSPRAPNSIRAKILIALQEMVRDVEMGVEVRSRRLLFVKLGSTIPLQVVGRKSESHVEAAGHGRASRATKRA